MLNNLFSKRSNIIIMFDTFYIWFGIHVEYKVTVQGALKSQARFQGHVTYNNVYCLQWTAAIGDNSEATQWCHYLSKYENTPPQLEKLACK